jgi:hypothetical protein
MTQSTFIFRENASRCELVSHAADHRKAEMEVSRLNFREDGFAYTAITGIFADVAQARRYAQLRCKGMNCDQAMRVLREASEPDREPKRVDRSRWRNTRSAKFRAHP